MNTENWQQENTEYFDSDLLDDDLYDDRYRKSKQKHKSNSARRKIEMLQDQKELRNEISDYLSDS